MRCANFTHFTQIKVIFHERYGMKRGLNGWARQGGPDTRVSLLSPYAPGQIHVPF